MLCCCASDTSVAARTGHGSHSRGFECVSVAVFVGGASLAGEGRVQLLAIFALARVNNASCRAVMPWQVSVASFCCSHFKFVAVRANWARFARTLGSQVLIGTRRAVNLRFKSIFSESARCCGVSSLVTSFGRAEVSAITNSSCILICTVKSNGAINAIVS